MDAVLHTLLLRLTFFFFNDTATTEIYTLSLHDALPISARGGASCCSDDLRSREHALLPRRGEPPRERLGDRARVLGRLDVDPLDVRLTREPRPLALGVAHRVSLHPPERLVLGEASLLERDELPIADRLARGQRGRVALDKEPAYFLPEARGDERLGPPSQALSERRPVQRETEVGHVVRPARMSPASRLGERAAARPHDLEGPDHPHRVVRVEARRDRRRHAVEPLPERRSPLPGREGGQFAAEERIGGGRPGGAPPERADGEPRRAG